eukprot:3237601-Rhodomonas_salina.1
METFTGVCDESRFQWKAHYDEEARVAKGQSIRALRVDFKLTLGNHDSSVPRLGRGCAVAPYPTLYL